MQDSRIDPANSQILTDLEKGVLKSGYLPNRTEDGYYQSP